ncbi:vasotab-TY3-like [Neocloeon triangulifer]|uniref:vasotab-TY3-like n=1 Tax=Neocloeon triangulifer TaxID=2078957 RepID=UPI00286EDC5C|nr:vasotab-TY3-like [Neocloeon triangulifer]
MKFAVFCIIASLVLLEVSAQGAGGDCPTICPLNYAPICGKNSKGELKTFSNECGMRAQNCNGKNDFAQEKTGACD